MNEPLRIEKNVSEAILTVGEYFRDEVHGGIAAVLRSYAPHFAPFKFLPSSRRPTRWDKLRYDAGSLLRLGWKLLWDRKIRIVHIHTAAGGSFTKHLHYARLARWMGRRVIFHCHASRFIPWYESLPSGRRERVLKGICALDRLIVLSATWKRYFHSIGVPAERVEVLNNIVDYPRGERDAHEAAAPLRLLFLGEIGPRKGVFDLLEAVRLRNEAQPGCVSLDIGGNRRESELKEAIRRNGLEGCVRFHGFVSGGQKQELLRRADVLALPSYNEGLPISILEAMSYGCAILSTPVGGIPEVVTDNGILVPPGDIPALAEAIRTLQDEAVCTAMGRKSAERVKPFFPDAVIASLESIYRALL